MTKPNQTRSATLESYVSPCKAPKNMCFWVWGSGRPADVTKFTKMSRANIYPGRFGRVGILLTITTISNNSGNMRGFKSTKCSCVQGSKRTQDPGPAGVNKVVTAASKHTGDAHPSQFPAYCFQELLRRTPAGTSDVRTALKLPGGVPSSLKTQKDPETQLKPGERGAERQYHRLRLPR